MLPQLVGRLHLGPLDVHHVRDELKPVGVVQVLSGFRLHGFQLGLRALGVQTLFDGLRVSASFLLLVVRGFFLFFFFALELFLFFAKTKLFLAFEDGFFVLIIICFLLYNLGMVFDLVKVALEEGSNAYLDTRNAFSESFQDLLEPTYISLCHWIFQIFKERVFIAHFDIVFSHLVLIKEVLRPLNIVFTLLFDVVRVYVRVYSIL